MIPVLATGLISQGCFGSKIASHHLPVEEASSSAPHSNEAAELGISNSPLHSPVSKSQLCYSKRVKEKVAKQLHKNKELLAEIVAKTLVEGEEGYSKEVIDTMNFASAMGLSWGGDDNSLLNLFFAIDKEKSEFVSVSKIKGLRELKNLKCTLNLKATQEKCQRQWDFLGLKMFSLSLLRCNRVFGFLGLLLGFCGS